MTESTNNQSNADKLKNVGSAIGEREKRAKESNLEINIEGKIRVAESVRFLKEIAANGEKTNVLEDRLKHGFFFDTGRNWKSFAIFQESGEKGKGFRIWLKQDQVNGQPSSEVNIYLLEKKAPYASYEGPVSYTDEYGTFQYDKEARFSFDIDENGLNSRGDKNIRTQAGVDHAYAFINTLSQNANFSPPTKMADKMVDAMLAQLKK